MSLDPGIAQAIVGGKVLDTSGIKPAASVIEVDTPEGKIKVLLQHCVVTAFSQAIHAELVEAVARRVVDLMRQENVRLKAENNRRLTQLHDMHSDKTACTQSPCSHPDHG